MPTTAGQAKPTTTEARMLRLAAGYRPLPGVHDELMDADGDIHPHWRSLLAQFDKLGQPGLQAAFAAADRHLRASGVFYRVYDDPQATDRPWPLSHVPLVVTPRDWAVITQGVIDRISLIEQIVADAYGPQKLTGDGLLPAALLAGNPEFLRPMVGVKPVGGRHIALYAVDLGRGPDGAWWVIRERTQAPSGAGYAVENRIALSRALPDIYRAFKVERLAGFFDDFRARLRSFGAGGDAGVCVLTPGPLNEVYFEHAYLARYLGFPLVEGQDLTVRGRRLYLRTTAGLMPINVLWRRVDGDWVDPLELDTRSAIGVPGLVDAVRAGNVALTNAIGSGIAEAPALLGFLPAIAQKLNGRPLLLPNVATWWCGQARERAFVLDNLDDMVIAPALGARLASLPDRAPVVAAELDRTRRAEIAAEMVRRGVDFVGQEVVQLSTTPVWTGDRLEPRPFMLRVFVAATENGWTVMPGGLGLIGERGDTRAVTMQRGGRSADVWVLSDNPVPRKSLLPEPADMPLRRATGAPPARAADNLFWLARYLERAEATLRVIRALASRVAERPDVQGDDIQALTDLLWKWGAIQADGSAASGQAAATALYGGGPGAVPQLVTGARVAAANIRDRFPPDAWRILDELAASVAAAARRFDPANVLDTTNGALRSLAALTGLELENMSRITGWLFLRLGRRIERAIAICRSVRQLTDRGGDPDRLDALLELADSQITYRTRYLMGAARAPVIDLVLFDEGNPRSLAFQVIRITEHLRKLPKLPDGRPSPALVTLGDLAGALAQESPRAIGNDALIGFENRLMQLSNEISQSWFTYREPMGVRR